MFNEMINEERLLQMGNVVQAAFSTFDDIVLLLAGIGAALDFWAAGHDMTVQELDSAIESFVKVAKSAHEEMGLPEKEEVPKFKITVKPCETEQ